MFARIWCVPSQKTIAVVVLFAFAGMLGHSSPASAQPPPGTPSPSKEPSSAPDPAGAPPGGAVDSAGADGTGENDDSRSNRARELFIKGAKATEELRWDDAARYFRQSYEISGAPSALFNLGLSLRSLGKHLEARQVFDDILVTGQFPGGTPRSEIERLRREADARLGSLKLRGLSTELRYRIDLDGANRPDYGTRPLLLQTNPGSHSLVVRKRKDFEPYVWNGELKDGMQIELTPVFKKRIKLKPRLVSKWWFWVIVGTVAAGTAVALGLTLRDRSGLQPESDVRIDL